VLNKSHGSRYVSFKLKIQISSNPIVFSLDDTSTRDSLDVMRSIIDRDIARLEESIRALKSRRNELSPISRLPVEILCNIFSLIVNVGNIYCFCRSPKSWTNFSQVSQHWRSTALSAPDLWTEILVGYPRWAQEMLTRSKMANLTIRFDFSSDTSNTAIETVRSCLYEMNRVEALIIFTSGLMLLEEIFRDLPKSAPQLHTLRIISQSFHSACSIHEDFLYDTERLQCVELANCKISWDSRLLTGLTRLHLEDSWEANSSITQVLHALQRMPALTELRLKDSILDDSEGPSTYPVVDLPCLRVLNISSGVGALTTFLRHITIPHSAILNLTCRETQSTQIDFTNFLSVLATKFLSSLVIRRLGLRVLDVCHYVPVIYGLEFNFWTTASRSQLQLIFKLTWPSPEPLNHVTALTCAFDAFKLSLAFLTILQISTSEYIDSQTWVKTFGKLPLLKQVCVEDSASYSVFEALVYKTKAAENSNTAYRDVSFPKLRHIDLEGTYFFGGDPGSITVDMLLDCLMERCERDAEVQELRLEECYYISSDDVERLKEIVVDVTWDGKELTDEDNT
jgi:hypothetical protein